MTYRISKDFTFSASHVLEGLPEGHQCGRLHGHNYTVRIQLTSPGLNDLGFVLDYGELAPLQEWIGDVLDHRHLNDCVTVNPTAENLAFHIAGQVRILLHPPAGVLVQVGVSETPKTWAWWSDGRP